MSEESIRARQAEWEQLLAQYDRGNGAKRDRSKLLRPLFNDLNEALDLLDQQSVLGRAIEQERRTSQALAETVQELTEALDQERNASTVTITKAALTEAGGVLTREETADGHIVLTAQRGSAVARLYLEASMLEKERDQERKRADTAYLSGAKSIGQWFCENGHVLVRATDMGPGPEPVCPVCAALEAAWARANAAEKALEPWTAAAQIRTWCDICSHIHDPEDGKCDSPSTTAAVGRCMCPWRPKQVVLQAVANQRGEALREIAEAAEGVIDRLAGFSMYEEAHLRAMLTKHAKTIEALDP